MAGGSDEMNVGKKYWGDGVWNGVSEEGVEADGFRRMEVLRCEFPQRAQMLGRVVTSKAQAIRRAVERGGGERPAIRDLWAFSFCIRDGTRRHHKGSG